MRRHSAFGFIVLCVVTAIPGGVYGDPVEKAAAAVRDTHRWLWAKKPPHSGRRAEFEKLAKEIDWLEHLIESYGTVVPKQADVWGEARLTRYRHEYEREISKRFDSGVFNETLQGAIRRSDQSLLSLALSINAASGGASQPSNAALALVNDPNAATVIQRTPPAALDLKQFKAQEISLEPTVLNDQLARYLDHLNELRRINEGADTADSRGYALNLVRVPVSVLPGHHTRKGYAAEIAFTVTPYLSDDLLPTTMRNLIINDVTQVLSLPLVQLFNNEPEYASVFINNYWMHHARVRRWMMAYEEWLRGLRCISKQKRQKPNKGMAKPEEIPAPFPTFPDLPVPSTNNSKSAKPKLHVVHARRAATDRPNFPGAAEAEISCADLDFLYSLRPYLQFRFTQIAAEAASERDSSTKSRARIQPELKVQPLIRRVVPWPPECRPLEKQKESKPLLIEVSASQFAAFLDGLADSLLLTNGRTKLSTAGANLCMMVDKKPVPYRFVLAIPPTYRPDDLVNFRQVPFYLPDERSPTPILGGLRTAVEMELRKPYDNFISDILNRGVEKPRPGADAEKPSLTVGFFERGGPSTASAANSGTSSSPLGSSQLLPTYGFDGFMDVALDVYFHLTTDPRNVPYISVADIEQYLQDELRNVFQFLQKPENQRLWDLCNCELARAVETHDVRSLFAIQSAFINSLNGATRHTLTAALAWAIVVDAARLNEKLTAEMVSLSQAKHCGCLEVQGLQFVGPRERLTPEAHEAFKEYVRCRWPIIAFSLDPATNDQNVADVFSRRRELQLAVAVAVANGKVSPSVAGRFVRQTEMDMETIALNRTAIGFSHGGDTFGWRFYPRVQTPEVPGNLVAFGQTLFGGPTRDCELRDRQLEPAVRECVAVVMMPSFVPYVTIKSRSNWFALANPRKKQLTMHDDLRITRTLHALEIAVNSVPDAVYRPDDLSIMSDTLDQLKHRLPVQESIVEVPYENTMGGFELFDTGVGALAPRLDGWYGAPGIDREGVTTLFLVGKRFSVHETRVIVGGRYVPFRMLSRNVLEVSIPPGVQGLADPRFRDKVDVQLAAPYGPSASHLFIPFVPRPMATNRFFWSTTPSTVEIHWKDGQPPTAQAIVATVPPEIRFSTPTTSAPTLLPVDLTINEIFNNGELVLHNVTLKARLDVQPSRYVIDGDQFNALRDALITTANNRFKIKNPAPDETARWVVRGLVNVVGGIPEPITSSMEFDVTFKRLP